ncbi:pyridoxamine 5'-phosphate oxidase family protein [Oscillibacter sp.]|uniref:pyridoxamine 5'-phosphate oxidase family protein n=1 Tax=Oscillibacter sp. TaxID=1945593 RepID=UPI002609F6AF|nr:pyridoxamine 5'-phosphate oxidase family protein [Oscillibacter sp.]MDD3347421.1 pyridoxamine 5'-phosphate oxidase family protein [Oscillibacter sp.]
MAWFVYMLACGDGSLYTGCTDHVERRLAAHQSGKGAKYTRSHLPVSLVYQERVPDKSAALRRELQIKKLSRKEKWELIKKEEHCKMEMRRKDRQQSAEFAWSVVDKCAYAFLAMTAVDGRAYGVPLTIVRDGETVYFHSALTGRKADALRKNPKVCLNCVGQAQIQPECFSVRYESAVAFGSVAEITDAAEKRKALRLLCLRHTPESMDRFDSAADAALAQTAVWRLAVEEITGKART